MYDTTFEWDETKNRNNIDKHGVSFEEAQFAFADPRRLMYSDVKHSTGEKRYFCYGKAGGKVLTVRFTLRGENIRLIGAAYWRKGALLYENR